MLKEDGYYIRVLSFLFGLQNICDSRQVKFFENEVLI